MATFEMTEEKLASIVANAVAAALAANKGGKVAKVKAVKTISPELKEKVLAAVKADPRKTPGTRKDGTTYENGYKCYMAMRMVSAMKKHPDTEFSAETLISVGKAYGLTE